MIDVYVIPEEGVNKLVIQTEEGKKEILSSKGPITRAYSPKKKRILALLTLEKKAILYNIEKDEIVLEVPIENLYSLEYARSDDGHKVAIAAAYTQGNKIVSKLYVIEGDKIVREESYDYPISIERKGEELLVEKASRSFYPQDTKNSVEKRKEIIEEIREEIKSVENEIEKIKSEIKAEEKEIEKELKENDYEETEIEEI